MRLHGHLKRVGKQSSFFGQVVFDRIEIGNVSLSGLTVPARLAPHVYVGKDVQLLIWTIMFFGILLAVAHGKEIHSVNQLHFFVSAMLAVGVCAASIVWVCFQLWAILLVISSGFIAYVLFSLWLDICGFGE